MNLNGATKKQINHCNLTNNNANFQWMQIVDIDIYNMEKYLLNWCSRQKKAWLLNNNEILQF